jgi:hypothetical protein
VTGESTSESVTGESPSAAGPPLVRVERGDPTDEELAAVVAVVAARVAGARAAAAAQRPRSGRSEWADPARSVRGAHQHGPGRWRSAAFPR